MYCMGNVDLSCLGQVSPKTRRAVRSFFLNYLFNCGARQKYEGFRQPSEYFGNCSKYLVNKCSTSRTVYGKPYLVEYSWYHQSIIIYHPLDIWYVVLLYIVDIFNSHICRYGVGSLMAYQIDRPRLI